MNCISTDGNAVLARFGLETVNPYEHLVVSIPWRPEDMIKQTRSQDLLPSHPTGLELKADALGMSLMMQATESHINRKSSKTILREKTSFFAH